MSITDELREWAARELASWKMARERYDALAAIADRIDAEHESAIQQALMGEGGVPATDENMAGHGWVRLPVDMDGECVNFGDKMVAPNGTRGRVVSFHKGSPMNDYVGIAFDGYPHQLYWCHECRHYHATTVEDVLTELVEKFSEEGDLDLIAEYAKLRLAEGEDA